MSKFRKYVPTEIPITLSTGFSHFEDDERERTCEQLEYIGFYSQALFRMVKAAIENLGDFDDKDIQWAHYDMIHTCDIGVSVVSAIAPLLDFFDEETIPETELNEIEKPVEAVKVTETPNLCRRAKRLKYLLWRCSCRRFSITSICRSRFTTPCGSMSGKSITKAMKRCWKVSRHRPNTSRRCSWLTPNAR